MKKKGDRKRKKNKKQKQTKTHTKTKTTTKTPKQNIHKNMVFTVRTHQLFVRLQYCRILPGVHVMGMQYGVFYHARPRQCSSAHKIQTNTHNNTIPPHRPRGEGCRAWSPRLDQACINQWGNHELGLLSPPPGLRECAERVAIASKHNVHQHWGILVSQERPAQHAVIPRSRGRSRRAKKTRNCIQQRKKGKGKENME